METLKKQGANVGNAINGILGSKKFIFALFAMVVLVVEKKLGLELDTETKRLLFGIAATAIAGQAMADLGKSRAQVVAAKPEDKKDA